MRTVNIDRVYVGSRLDAVRTSLERLKGLRGRGDGAAALADPDRFAIAEHHARRSLECALDVARHLLAKEGTFKPASYPELMDGLVRLGAIPAPLAQRARALAEERNRLVHLGPEVTPQELHGLIAGPLDHLETFCTHIDKFVRAKVQEP
jgi:uncharacterized protein YutE (UPF0331/DUF86 family)